MFYNLYSVKPISSEGHHKKSSYYLGKTAFNLSIYKFMSIYKLIIALDKHYNKNNLCFFEVVRMNKCNKKKRALGFKN